MENIPWYRNPEFRKYFDLNNPNEVYYWPDKFLSPRATLNRRGSEGLINLSYGYNITGLGAIDVSLGIADYRINSAAVVNPGQTLAFADALDWWIVRQSADRYNGVEASLVQAIAYRYPVKGGDPRNGKAAVVYFDGHGEALGRDQVVGNSRLWNISK